MRRSPHRVTALLVAISLSGCTLSERAAPGGGTTDYQAPRKVKQRSVAAESEKREQAPTSGEETDQQGPSEIAASGGVEGAVAGGVVGGVSGGSVAAPAPAPTRILPPRAPPPPVTSAQGKGMAIAPTGGLPRPEPKPMEDRRAPLDAADGNAFQAHAANPFVDPKKDRLSTFAIDVDTASYSLMRSYVGQQALPPAASVRVEEYVNYFKYRYAPPSSGAFSVNLEGAPSPFTRGHQLLRVGVQGKAVSRSERKTAHLTFLVDTSGSMGGPDRLGLAQQAMKLAVKNLGENDTVAIATYAGSSRLVLPSTSAGDRNRIYAAIDSLGSGGGTSMGSGMELAYKQAVKKAGGNVVSRVIVLTDGDTNIGPNLSAASMLESIKKYVAEGVTMTTVGFGMGNYRDDLMEKLADSGNGNCFYVDGMREAKKVFETQLTGTLEVIAKDVKLQVEFNPDAVAAYRLVGYENRDIADRDFRNDKVDAGEIGAGHSVTALYEVQLTGKSQDLGMVRIRAKTPNGTQASEQAFPFTRKDLKETLADASSDLRFAVAVAGTADILRKSQASESWSLATAEKLARSATERDPDREEFVRLLGQLRPLWARQYSVSAR
ncbi:MAG: von Willebrand factor type A domain-containing protein [Myxococcota bacterium]|nr:von Willebrand factor type A domain-containing protein [Myxococcota bacterium]